MALSRCRSDLPAPPGYCPSNISVQSDVTNQTDNNLLIKKCWEVALAPIKQVIFLNYYIKHELYKLLHKQNTWLDLCEKSKISTRSAWVKLESFIWQLKERFHRGSYVVTNMECNLNNSLYKWLLGLNPSRVVNITLALYLGCLLGLITLEDKRETLIRVLTSGSITTATWKILVNE